MHSCTNLKILTGNSKFIFFTKCTSKPNKNFQESKMYEVAKCQLEKTTEYMDQSGEKTCTQTCDYI